MTVRLPPNATLDAAEAEVVRRFGLDGIDLEFVLSDLMTDETQPVAKTTTLGSLDLEQFTLIIQRLVRVPDMMGDEQEQAHGTRLGSETISVGSASDGCHVSYKFVTLDNGDEFSLGFGPMVTVQDAMGAVAGRYPGKSGDDVTLILRGKSLASRIVLDRLRVGDSHISVYFHEPDPLILLSVQEADA
jgi:hypothetical protein